jgi:hypothetical protein
MRYEQAVLEALRAAERPLSHRDLRTLIDPQGTDYSAVSNGIGNVLSALHRAREVQREKIDGRYHYRLASGGIDALQLREILLPFARYAVAVLALRDESAPDDRIEHRVNDATLTIGDLRRIAALCQGRI